MHQIWYESSRMRRAECSKLVRHSVVGCRRILFSCNSTVQGLSMEISSNSVLQIQKVSEPICELVATENIVVSAEFLMDMLFASTCGTVMEVAIRFCSSSSTLWHFVAALLAVLGTFFFFLTRAGSVLLDIVHSKSSIGSHTVKILRHRCRQLKSWPITLFWGGPG